MADSLSLDLELLRKVVSKKVYLNDVGIGLCPFHEEKNPSFNIFVSKSGKARFNCFGCGATGDIFDYLKLTEGLNFHAARQLLLGGTFSSSGESGCETIQNPFCERDCPKYAALREDYNYLVARASPIEPPTAASTLQAKTIHDLEQWIKRLLEEVTELRARRS